VFTHTGVHAKVVTNFRYLNLIFTPFAATRFPHSSLGYATVIHRNESELISSFHI